MSRKFVLPVAVLGLAAAGFLLHGAFRPDQHAAAGVRVEKGPLTVWTDYAGQLEARRVETIMSRVPGSAVIVELAPDGAPVKKGDVLVRFDSSQVELDLVSLEREYALARADHESLTRAQFPIEIKDLEMQLLEAEATYDAEKQYLDGSRDLLKEELVSEQEVRQQELKVEQVRAKVDKLRTQLELTRQFLHPSQTERAQAALLAAERQLALKRQQFENCTVRAPDDGLVVYRPLHVGGEYRTARVGDTIYRNQPFMYFPDMSDLIVHCYVPEAELARVAAGSECSMTPLAYPDLKLAGRVESVGLMAQAKPGLQAWQKYFHVVIGLEGSDERVRTDMSVTARIFSYHNPAAVLIPRAAVHWDGGTAHCRVRRGRRTELREIQLGRADAARYEVLAGLEPGELVVNE
ncbi:MAG: efflux RND transporter periplasmic adaptor subunit [Kiritimatiellae bacterium]|nr:efflux RND transporter periplasmic adaptor subunit [Kiritimatiellia bacterium]